MIWTMMLATPAVAGGVCCPAALGRTRRGARPSAAAAPRARPCTCPCRRAWWSPRSTTRWRGAASAATASTCRDVPSRAHYTQRSAARAGGPGRSNARRGGQEVARNGRGIVAPATARGDRAGPASVRTYVLLAVPGRAPSVDIHDSDRHGSDGLALSRTWWATVAGAVAGPAACCMCSCGRCCCYCGALDYWSADVVWQNRLPGLDWPDLPRGGGAGRGESNLLLASFFFLTKLLAWISCLSLILVQ